MMFRMISKPIPGETPSRSHTIQRRNSLNSRWSFVLTVYTHGLEADPVLHALPTHSFPSLSFRNVLISLA